MAAERTVSDLGEALLLLAEKPMPVGINVKVHSVQMQHAPSLLQLLRRGETKYQWRVRSVVRVEQLAKVFICFDTVDHAVLPLLDMDPKDDQAGRLLRRLAWDIRHLARKVDGRHGVLNLAAFQVSGMLMDANNEMMKEDVAIDENKVAGMRQGIEALKPMLVLLDDDELGTGGGGGDEADRELEGERTIASLFEGLALYDERPSPESILLNIPSVQMDQAPHLLQLLRKGEKQYKWDVPNVLKVDRVAEVCICLDTVHLAVLPLLDIDARDVVAGRLLRRYGRDIRRHALEIDGDEGNFYLAASDVANILIHSNDDILKKGKAIGEDKVAEIREAMEALKATLVMLPEDEVGGGGAAGGEHE